MKRSRLAKSRSRRLRLACEQLEVRRVLDGSAMPLWDQMPEVAGPSLTLDSGMTATANAQFGDFTYTSSNGEVTITGYTGAGGAVEIPAEIDGLPVMLIGDSAFSGKGNVTSVSIPYRLTSIGSRAFYSCTSLTTITIPVGVTRVYAATFYNCRRLTSISIPAGVTSIDSEAFSICTDLTTVTLPAGVKTIGVSAFSDCMSLSSIVLPSTVTLIDRKAFFNCSGMQSVTVPDSVTRIGDYAFSGCTALSDVTLQPSQGASSLQLGVSAFSNCSTLSSIRIPSSVWSIADSVFSNCSALTSVVLPSSVMSIGDSAFQYCTALTNVTLNTAMSLGANAFSNCSSLKNIYAWGNAPSAHPSAFTSSPITVNRRDGKSGWSTTLAGAPVVLFGSDFLYAVSDYEVTITGSSLAGSALTIPAQLPTELGCLPVVSIGSNAFRSKSWTSVTIPTSVLSIGSSAFKGCKRLASISIPSSVTSIGSSAFEDCTGLTSLSIPYGVATIASAAFAGCTGLLTITVDAANPIYAGVDGVLYEKSTSTLIQYPAGRTGSIEINVVTTRIGPSAFSGCINLTNVVIPESVISIGDFAFYGCQQIKNLLLPSGLTKIGDLAFEYCFGLTSVVIPANVTSIAGTAFRTCSRLSAIEVDKANSAYASLNGVLYDRSFSTLIICPSGKAGSVAIPYTVTNIARSAFYVCHSLRSVYFFDKPPILTDGTLDHYWWPYLEKFAIFRPSSATGWSSSFADHYVGMFQSIVVPAGQSSAVYIASDAESLLKQGLGTAILTTASTRTGGTVVEAGELVVRSKNAIGTGLLEVQAGAKVTFQSGYDTVSVTSLTLADTAKLELGTSKLAIAANGFTESDIRSQLIAGRNGGTWNGTSGITSTFAGVDRAIGYRVADGVMEVAYAAPGDSNLDGVIDILDLSEILSAGKFNTGATANWQQGDTNYDGVLDILDLSEILGTSLFNQGSYLTQPAASSAAVDTGTVATFDQSLVFAALAMETDDQPVVKRKIAERSPV